MKGKKSFCIWAVCSILSLFIMGCSGKTDSSVESNSEEDAIKKEEVTTQDSTESDEKDSASNVMFTDYADNYICEKNGWTARYYSGGIEIESPKREIPLIDLESDYPVSIAILATENGFYYGRDNALCFFDFEKGEEEKVVNGAEWDCMSPILTYEGKLYYITDSMNDPTVKYLDELDIENKTTRRLDLPDLRDEIVAGADGLYYISQAPYLGNSSLYKVDITSGTAEKLDDSVGMNLTVSNEDILYYCKYTEEGSALGVYDTNTGKKEEISFDNIEYEKIGEPVYATSEHVYLMVSDGGNDICYFYRRNIDDGSVEELLRESGLIYLRTRVGKAYCAKSNTYGEPSFCIISLDLETKEIFRTETIPGRPLAISSDSGTTYSLEMDENQNARYHYERIPFMAN